MLQTCIDAFVSFFTTFLLKDKPVGLHGFIQSKPKGFTYLPFFVILPSGGLY